MSRINDLTGRQFGHLKVISLSPHKSPQGRTMWTCLCTCKTVKDIMAHRLINNTVKSCGCLRRRGFPARRHDLAGQVFGELTVLRVLEREPDDVSVSPRTLRWVCRCSCENTVVVIANNLHQRKVKSCGCLREINCISLAKKRTLPDLQSAKNTLFYTYKKSAEYRGMEFKLSMEEMLSIVTQNCTYCGTPPSQKIAATRNNPDLVLTYNGIDRTDNEVTYIISNCVPCCKKCNFAKGGATVEEFKEHISKIARHVHLATA